MIIANRARAAQSAVWSLAESVGLVVVSFSALTIYSRFLSPADFGMFSMVLAVVEVLNLFITMFFHDALLQRPDVGKAHFDSVFTVSVVTSLVLLGACILLGPAVGRLFGNKGAGAVLAVTAISFPCTALSATIIPSQRRKLQFRAVALRSIVGRLTGAGIGIALTLLGAGPWALSAQYVLVALSGSIVLWIMADERPSLRFDWPALRSLLAFGGYSISALFLTFAVSRIYTIIVGIRLGAQLTGYLNLSFRIVDMLWSIAAAAIAQAALPILARVQGEPGRLKKAYLIALSFCAITLFPAFAGIALLAPEIVETIFGHQWLPSVPYVTILALLVLTRLPRQLARPTLSAVGRPQDAMVTGAADMCFTLLFVVLCGGRTLSTAVLILVLREGVMVVLTSFLLRRATGIGYVDQLRAIAPSVTTSVLMAAVVWIARSAAIKWGISPAIRLATLVPVGVVTLLSASWLFHRDLLRRLVSFVMAAHGPAKAELVGSGAVVR